MLNIMKAIQNPDEPKNSGKVTADADQVITDRSRRNGSRGSDWDGGRFQTNPVPRYLASWRPHAVPDRPISPTRTTDFLNNLIVE